MRKDNSDRIHKWAATSLRTASALLLTLILCGPAVAQTREFKANGAFASAFGCSESQTSFDCIQVFVFTESANGQTTNGQTITQLIYEDTVSDLTGAFLQETDGFGTIPNSAFQVHALTDSLNVDTSTLSPDVFSQEICTIDPITMNFTCNPISGGVVTGTWNVIPHLDTFHSSGASSEISPNTKFITNGTSDSQAALTNVNVLGAALANVTGQVGKQINTFISVQVLH
jgi:hypothetical protein